MDAKKIIWHNPMSTPDKTLSKLIIDTSVTSSAILNARGILTKSPLDTIIICHCNRGTNWYNQTRKKIIATKIRKDKI